VRGDFLLELMEDDEPSKNICSRCLTSSIKSLAGVKVICLLQGFFDLASVLDIFNKFPFIE